MRKIRRGAHIKIGIATHAFAKVLLVLAPHQDQMDLVQSRLPAPQDEKAASSDAFRETHIQQFGLCEDRP